MALAIALSALLAGCGGGSSSSDSAPAMEGSRETRTLTSRFTGTDYPLRIYLPPASAGPRASLPVVYLLDGESWFETAVSMAEATDTRVIIVAVETAGQRNRDFVPSNVCTPNGGGLVAYLDFLRLELLPFVEAHIGGAPDRRALFGHSHGGSFVLWAMFAQAPGQHTFSAYLASDASLGCMLTMADDWEQAYASAHSALPVRLHLSYATQGNQAANVSYGNVLAGRNHAQLAFMARGYVGTHNGIVPQALEDAIRFAFPAAP